MVVKVREFVKKHGVPREAVFAWRRYGIVSDVGHGLIDDDEGQKVVDLMKSRMEERERRLKEMAIAREKSKGLKAWLTRNPSWYDDHHRIKVMKFVTVDPDTGCWTCSRYIGPHGYSTWRSPNKGLIRACSTHRFMYSYYKGKIPKGLSLDHLCRNRACCNPEHLEAVTIQVNVLRGEGPMALNLRKTHCKHGHEFNAENTAYTLRDGRVRRACKECKREETRRRRRENPEKMRQYVRDHYRRKREKKMASNG